MNNMKYVFIPILIFAGMWMLWYMSGGPLRESSKKKFIGPSDDGTLQLKDEYNRGKLDLSL